MLRMLCTIEIEWAETSACDNEQRRWEFHADRRIAHKLAGMDPQTVRNE